MAIIIKTRDSKYCWRCEKKKKKKNFCALSVGMNVGAASMENSMGFPQKNKKQNSHMIQQSHLW